MKNKDLIKKLQELDPELNVAIEFADLGIGGNQVAIIDSIVEESDDGRITLASTAHLC